MLDSFNSGDYGYITVSHVSYVIGFSNCTDYTLPKPCMTFDIYTNIYVSMNDSAIAGPKPE
jgi:hypothetical protein